MNLLRHLKSRIRCQSSFSFGIKKVMGVDPRASELHGHLFHCSELQKGIHLLFYQYLVRGDAKIGQGKRVGGGGRDWNWMERPFLYFPGPTDPRRSGSRPLKNKNGGWQKAGEMGYRSSDGSDWLSKMALNPLKVDGKCEAEEDEAEGYLCLKCCFFLNGSTCLCVL